LGGGVLEPTQKRPIDAECNGVREMLRVDGRVSTLVSKVCAECLPAGGFERTARRAARHRRRNPHEDASNYCQRQTRQHDGTRDPTQERAGQHGDSNATEHRR